MDYILTAAGVLIALALLAISFIAGLVIAQPPPLQEANSKDPANTDTQRLDDIEERFTAKIAAVWRAMYEHDRQIDAQRHGIDKFGVDVDAVTMRTDNLEDRLARAERAVEKRNAWAGVDVDHRVDNLETRIDARIDDIEKELRNEIRGLEASMISIDSPARLVERVDIALTERDHDYADLRVLLNELNSKLEKLRGEVEYKADCLEGNFEYLRDIIKPLHGVRIKYKDAFGSTGALSMEVLSDSIRADAADQVRRAVEYTITCKTFEEMLARIASGDIIEIDFRLTSSSSSDSNITVQRSDFSNCDCA